MKSTTGVLEEDMYDTSNRNSCALTCFQISLLFDVPVSGASSGISIERLVKLPFNIKAFVDSLFT